LKDQADNGCNRIGSFNRGAGGRCRWQIAGALGRNIAADDEAISSGRPSPQRSPIAVFDDVFLRLMERADTQALTLLSDNLSGISAAPRKAIRQLAFHDDVLVAGAVLRRSSRLPDKDLVEIANTRGEKHLLEISCRQTVSASLSDKLVERGEKAVLSKLIQNLGARFSEAGYAAFVAKAKRDDGLAEKLVLLSDVPPALRR